MKRILFYKRIKKCTLFFLFSFIMYNCFGQDEQPSHKPYMWVPQGVGDNQVRNFNSIKLKKLNENIGVPQTNSFKLGNFFGMLDYFFKVYNFQYLHVYIGVCTGTTSVPNGFDNKLIFIFAPATDDGSNSDIAYYILPDFSIQLTIEFSN